MRKLLILGAAFLVLILYQMHKVPAEPSSIRTAEVIKLEDLDASTGLRQITVRFEGGEERAIQTYVPFFYKVGYSAHVAVHERYLFSDVYRIVSDASAGQVD